MSSPEPEEPELPPTHTRFTLVAWLCGLSGILYLDRICMGQAIVPVQRELGLSNTEVSFVLMSFTLAYGLFAVPAGWLGDKLGARTVLTALVVAWSICTALTGAAVGLIMLVAARFLFGAAEAGAFPNVAKVVSRWFAAGERGRVQGALLAASQIGAVASPFLAAWMIREVGWRWMFVAFGLVGFVWAIGFWRWFRDDPADHPAVNETELHAIRADSPPPPLDPGPVPWGAVAVNRGIIVLSCIMVFGAFYTYFFYSWFQKYLNASRGVENIEAGNLTSLVMAGSAVGVLFGGWLADRLSKCANPVAARRYLGVCCYLVAAACLFLGVRQDDALSLALLWGATVSVMHITLPNWWSFALPQAGKHTATLFALMNGIGVMGALASQGFVGIYADWQKDRGLTGRAAWDPLFDVYVCVLLANAVMWWLYRYRPLPEAPKEDEGW